MEVAGVDHRQRQGSHAVLAEALGQQLVVPQAHGLKPLAPGGEDARGGPAERFHEVAHTDVVEHGILPQRGFPESLRHGCRALQQGRDVQSHQGGGQEPHGGEDGEPAAHAVGVREHVAAPDGLGQLAQQSGGPGDHGHALGHGGRVVLEGLPEPAEKQPEGHGRLQRGAALAHDGDAPAPRVLVQQVAQGHHVRVVDVVALEVDPRVDSVLGAAEFVVIRVAAGLEQGAGTHIRAADPEHDHAVHQPAKPGRGGSNPSQLALPALLALFPEHLVR